MRYVQRDAKGKVIGHYAHAHDYANEEVADDHEDILAWQAEREEARKQVSPIGTLERRVATLEQRVIDLERKLAKK